MSTLTGLSNSNHSRGSIVRVKLYNFLTFDGVEVRPSPHLNVIVGPNGTGKSSIVCAICVCLGGATKLLGRAKTIKDFVKHGKKEGFVEIELCETSKARKNPVIRRRISAGDDSSTWLINNSVVKQAEVIKLVESMNIQLQNKCVFLPQDMVVEFAKMNMHQRLHETQQAVGSKTMCDAYEKLKKLYSTQSTQEAEITGKKRILEDEERKNGLLERDVARFKEREKYMSQTKLIEKKLLWVEYEKARALMSLKREERKVAADAMKQLKAEYQPMEEKLKAQEDALKNFKDSLVNSNLKRRQLIRDARGYQEMLTTLGDQLAEPKQKLEQAKKDEEERKANVDTYQKQIEAFEAELNALEPYDVIQNKIHERNSNLGEMKQKLEDVNYQLREVSEQRKHFSDQIHKIDDELKKMQDVRSQRLQMLRRFDESAYEALMWLEQNQGMFQQPILPPIVISVNILDQRYTSQIEAFFGGRDFVSFVAQNESDRELFLRKVRDSMNLKVNVVRAPAGNLADFKRKVSFEVLQRFGFEKMLIDVVEAPEPLLRYFCQYQFLHKVPIASSLSPAQIQAVTDQLPDVRSFFAGNSRFSVTRSKYRNSSSSRSGEIRPPRFLIASVDNQRKQVLERDLQNIHSSRHELDRRYSQLKGDDDQLRANLSRVQTEKNALKKVNDQRRVFMSNIQSRKQKLETALSTSFDVEKAEQDCQLALKKIHCDRMKYFTKLTTSLESVFTAASETVKASLLVTTAQGRVSFLLQQCHKTKDDYDSAKRASSNAEDVFENARKMALMKLKEAREKCGVKSPADDPNLITAFQKLPDDRDDLFELKHRNQAQADLCEGIDSSVVQCYNQRKVEIKALVEEVSRLEEDLKNRDHNISSLKEQWLEPLKDLITGINDRFCHFFSKHTHMKAAGEVCLVEHDDFSKYGIEIKVKFRDHEKLQALNAQRQSGGERSVSTMLYLMALQGGSQCPFRVVDEINQGMDPVNERHVFNLIVQAAAEGSQYFLLTPKLLQNLDYSDAVKVHMVNNGQEAVDYSTYNLESILQ